MRLSTCRPTRRKFCTTAFATGLAIGSTHSLSSAARPSAPGRIEAADIQIINLDRRYYCGWPTLTKRQSGELVVAYSGGRQAHVCPFGRVEWIRSRDNGATWSWPRTLIDGPIDDRDAGILETAQGSLLVTTFSSLAYEPILQRAQQESSWPAENLERWQAVHRRLTERQRQSALGVWMIRSTDNGLHWSSPARCMVNSPHGPIQLRDGRLLYAGKQLWAPEARIGTAVSHDDGQSWKWLAEIPTRPGDNHRDYHELHAVETTSGKLIVHIRNHNPTNSREILQTESSDGGSSWTTPRPIGVWGLPSHLLELHDGRLLMTYGYRQPPYGNQARLSEDDGQSWSEPLTISDDGTSGDLGYPSTVELEDGLLYTVWYEKMEGSSLAVLRARSWRLID